MMSVTAARTLATQTVVIVDGTAGMLERLETVLEGHCDVVFVESSAHAYSQIKRVQPNLVILCVQLHDMSGLQVLSMLRMDEETRHIPVVTYGMDPGDSTDTEGESPAIDTGMFAANAELPMN
jgi:CheY-like chemotaxis protein